MGFLKSLLAGLMFIGIYTSPSSGGELTADLGLESNLFAERALTKGPGQLTGSASLSFEYYIERYEQNEQIIIAPFARVDLEDGKRSHADLREFYWQKSVSDFEFQLGFRRVFWGVTELVHLVDIINQTDLVENIDGEDKLGQPMIQSNWMSGYGTFSFYWLPYFRERTFPGTDGRLRPSVPIDQDNATYESDEEQWHQDWALRWINTLGQFDIGLAYFNGTERQPVFVPRVSTDGSLSLRPHYRQTSRLSLDMLMVSGGWLLKSEVLTAKTSDKREAAFATGFEYTLVGVAGSRYDLGLLAEYLYDDRGRSFTPFEHDLFLGSRLALNDIGGTAVLAGAIIDTESGSMVSIVELERRLSDWWSIEMEARLFGKQDAKDLLYDLRDDSFMRMLIVRHW
jgi:hypothetical protein